MKNVYEEYRKRLLKNNVDILILEIFETFVGTDYVETLEDKDYEEILKELKNIQYTIDTTNKYTPIEKLGYSNIVFGYILRVESILSYNKFKIK